MTEQPIFHKESGQPYVSAYQKFLLQAPLGIFISTPQGRFITANHALAEMIGYTTPQELIDSITNISKQLYADPADREKFKELLASQAKVSNNECRMLRRDGSIFWVSRNARAVLDEKREITYYHGFVVDITASKQAVDKLKLQITSCCLHDQLTNLYNRAYLENELHRLNKSREFPISIISFAVDELEQINKTLGHEYGNEHLRRSAILLQKTLRQADILARSNGDQYVALLPKTGYQAGQKIIRRIRSSIEDYNLNTHDKPALSLSIGLAAAEVASQDLTSVFRQAEDHMYLDKSSKQGKSNLTHL